MKPHANNPGINTIGQAFGNKALAKGYIRAIERDIEANRRAVQAAHDQLELSLQEIINGINPETLQKIGQALIEELTEPLPRHTVSIARINHHWKDKTR